MIKKTDDLAARYQPAVIPTMRPVVLAMLPGIMPSTHMDVVAPLLALEKKGLIHLRVALENYPFLQSIGDCNLVVFCRNTEPKYQNVLESVLNKRIPYIYDLDDNLFEAPANTRDGEYYRVPERLELLKKYLKNATLVRIYSMQLLEQIKDLNPKAALVKPPLDWTAFGSFSSQPEPAPSTGGPVKIVYATSRRDDQLATIFTPALLRLQRENPEKVELHFWGYQPQEFKNYNNVYFHKFTPNYARFTKRFSQAGFEIGLAALLDDAFHRSKTNNKYREYAASGIAGVYSNVEVYTNCIKDRQNGLLVDNQPEAWYGAIKTLIEDVGLRRRIGRAAREDIEKTYNPKEFQETWHQQIQTAIGTTTPQSNQKASPQAAFSSKNIWLDKIQRAISTRENALHLFAHSKLHLTNLWWLIKVNALKRL